MILIMKPAKRTRKNVNYCQTKQQIIKYIIINNEMYVTELIWILNYLTASTFTIWITVYWKYSALKGIEDGLSKISFLKFEISILFQAFAKKKITRLCFKHPACLEIGNLLSRFMCFWPLFKTFGVLLFSVNNKMVMRTFR